MGLEPWEEIPANSTIVWQACYAMIFEFYFLFAAQWNQMTEAEKEQYKFGNGQTSGIEYVDSSISYIHDMPLEPNRVNAIAVARNVIFGKLEFAYHNRNGKYKIAAYAHHILRLLNNNQI